MSRKRLSWRLRAGLLIAKYLPIQLRRVLPDWLWRFVLSELQDDWAFPVILAKQDLDLSPIGYSSDSCPFRLDQTRLMSKAELDRLREESRIPSPPFDISEAPQRLYPMHKRHY